MVIRHEPGTVTRTASPKLALIYPLLLLLWLSSALFADSCEFSELDRRVGALEDAENRSFSANAAFLYWWTDAPGLTYALDDGTYLHPKMKPEVGCKLGFRYELPHDGWDLFLQITHLHSRAPTRQAARAGKVFVPLWITAADMPGGFVDSVRGHWRLHAGFVDLELGKTFGGGRFFFLRPYTGLRYAEIRQKYHLFYSGGNLFPGGQDHVYMTNKNFALGLRNGLDIDWKITRGWGIYSDLGFSLLYGTMLVHEEEKVSFEAGKRYHVIQRFSSQAASIDLALGLEWLKNFRCDRYRLSFQLGWEEHLFFAQNNFFHFISPGFTTPYSSRESLSFDGITLGGRLDF